MTLIALEARSTGSSNATVMGADTGTSITPLAGVTDWTDGAASVMLMSSIPTHSSLPAALPVTTRTWTSG